MTRLASLLVLGFALLPSAASAQAPSSSIQPGMRVRVWTSPAAEPVTGKVLSLEGGMLTMIGDKSGTPIGVSRDSITQVDVSRGRPSRGKGALIGAVTGLCFGALIGAGLSSGGNSMGPSGAGAGAIILGGLLTPVGALVGVIAGPGPERWTPASPASAKLSKAIAAPAPSLRFNFRF